MLFRSAAALGARAQVGCIAEHFGQGHQRVDLLGAGAGLPGLIFDGFSSAFSPADTETPILNSEAAIIENANTITFTISGILGEGMEDVMERIERDFAASDGDGMEIINPYGTNPVYNANLFVSQYCAAKEKEFADISIADMAADRKSVV